MVSGERRLAFLLDENVHRYITFGQGSIILKFNRKKIKNKQRNRSKYDKFFPITASCEAGRMFTGKRQMKPAAVMVLKMEHHKILSFLDNSHSPSLVVLAMQNWKLPRLIQKEKKSNV